MNWSKAQELTYALLRVVAGFVFFQFGAMKILGWYGGLPNGVSAPVLSETWIGGILETFGGPLILAGLLTRPVAFLLSGEMAVAYFQFHQPNGTWPLQNQGVAAALFCFLYLYMSAKGGGEYSVDAVLRKKGMGSLF